MADWATISSLATAGGTLILAVATFVSVRTANYAVRTAERALQVGLRPVLGSSRPQDPTESIRWGDGHHADLAGGQAVVDVTDEAIYLATSIRNVGAGLAVLHGWYAWPDAATAAPHHLGADEFRSQLRDIYVASGDVGFWQAAIRSADDPVRAPLLQTINAGRPFYIDVLYGDHEGGQRAVSRFGISPRSEDEPTWTCSVVRHWNLDRRDPRDR